MVCLVYFVLHLLSRWWKERCFHNGYLVEWRGVVKLIIRATLRAMWFGWAPLSRSCVQIHVDSDIKSSAHVELNFVGKITKLIIPLFLIVLIPLAFYCSVSKHEFSRARRRICSFVNVTAVSS